MYETSPNFLGPNFSTSVGKSSASENESSAPKTDSESFGKAHLLPFSFENFKFRLNLGLVGRFLDETEMIDLF